MKVLHVVWYLGQGGAQTYVHDLIKQHRIYEELTPEVLVLNQSGPLGKVLRVCPMRSIRTTVEATISCRTKRQTGGP